MNMKVQKLENALLAAKELGMVEIPWDWFKYLQSGWEIRQKKSKCGGNWAWFRPRSYREIMLHGCVCHHELDLRRLMDTKRADLGADLGRIKKDLNTRKPKESDIGKIYYLYPDSDEGEIVDRSEFVNIDPANVGWWTEISFFDVID